MNNNTIFIGITLFVIFLFFIIIAWLYWGSIGGYISLFVLFIIIILAIVLIYYSLNPTFTIITPSPNPTPPVPPVPPTQLSVKYGDTLSLTTSGFGIVPCGTSGNDYYLTTGTPQKIWHIQGSTLGQSVLYGDVINLSNRLSGFPQTKMIGMIIDEINDIWDVLIPNIQTDISLSFTINKAIGNTSTSNTVMYGDIVTLSYIDPLSRNNLFMYINLADRNTNCGYSIQLIPSSKATVTSRWTIS